MDDSQIKIRDENTQEECQMSIQGCPFCMSWIESTNKSITNSSDADEADIVARASKRVKSTSDDISSGLPADDSILNRFIRSEKFDDFRKLVLKEPANYKSIRADLEMDDDDIKNLSSKDSSHDPILKEIIATIISGPSGLSVADRRRIVEQSPEYEKFLTRVDEDAYNYEAHKKELEKNDPFVMELFHQDAECVDMLHVMDRVEAVKYLIDINLKSKSSVSENMDEVGLQRIVEYIQSKVTCQGAIVLYHLHSTGGNIDEAIESIKCYMRRNDEMLKYLESQEALLNLNLSTYEVN